MVIVIIPLNVTFVMKFLSKLFFVNLKKSGALNFTYEVGCWPTKNYILSPK